MYMQRCRNLRDVDRSWIFIIRTCYAIIYKSILNAYIDVCIYDEIGYIVYLITPISHYEFVIIDN